MKPGLPQQAMAGVIIVLAVIVTLLGGVILALGEGNEPAGKESAGIATATTFRIPTLPPADEGVTTTQITAPLPEITVFIIPTSTPQVAGFTPSPFVISPTSTLEACYIREGWIPYVVQPGDTLFRIGLRYGLTVDALMQGNCRSDRVVEVGEVLYVPPVTPRATPTSELSATPDMPVPKPTGTQTATDGACTNPDSIITSPPVGAVLSGVAAFRGTAQIPNFMFYKLEIRRDGTTSADYQTFFTSDRPVVQGVLAELDTRSFINGDYWVRLVVVDTTHNYPERCAILYTIHN